MLLYEVEGLDGNIKISKTQDLAHAAKEHSKTALDSSCTLDSSNYSQVCTKNTKECLAPDSEGLSLSLALRCSVWVDHNSADWKCVLNCELYVLDSIPRSHAGLRGPGQNSTTIKTYQNTPAGICAKAHSTSNSAQRGGGCFKDKKPIEDVGSCESWMAERMAQQTRWCIERWLGCRVTSLSLSIYLSVCLPACLSVCSS